MQLTRRPLRNFFRNTDNDYSTSNDVIGARLNELTIVESCHIVHII